MMISPEAYYKFNLKGKTKEEILKEIRSLKKEIRRFTKILEEDKESPELMVDPGPATIIWCDRLYLERAIKAYQEAGGEYIPTKAEQKDIDFNKALDDLQSIKLTYGGYLIGEEVRTLTIAKDKAILESYSLFGQIHPEGLEDQVYDKEDIIEQLKELHIGEWKRSYNDLLVMDGIEWKLEIRFFNDHRTKSYSGSNAFPYNFDALLELFNVIPYRDDYDNEGEENNEQDQD